MMLSHPVLLGFLWSLLIYSTSGQPQISSQETNKVYAYSYHFQHNGTTNSKDILRTVLGTDADFGIDPPAGQSIIKTFSSPSIRGFFTKGILPAGPLTQNYNSGFGSRFNTNSAIDNIKKVVESNLQPPNIASSLLPPISPDITNPFPGDFNNVNDIGLNFQKQDDFPKIPPPPPPISFQNRDAFPKIPPPSIDLNDFPKIPDPITNNNGVSRVENFSRNTPDGGKIEGKIETFSYNPAPVINSNSNYQENAQGFRRNENFVNNNQEITGHRTQSYFKQHFRTVTPNIESNNLNLNNRIDGPNPGNGHNNNQWWNVLNVLGGNDRSGNNEGNFGQQVERNVNQLQNNRNSELNRQFGSRISNFNNRQNSQSSYDSNRQPRQNLNNGYNAQNRNFNNQLSNNHGFRNTQNTNIPFNNRIDSNQGYQNRPNINAFSNTQPSNGGLNNQRGNVNNQHQVNAFRNQLNAYSNSQAENNAFVNHNNLNNQFNNDDTTKKVANIINDVNARLNNLNNNAGGRNNNLRLTWDDDVPQNLNTDWSRRQSNGNGRPFSNAHSGPLINQVGSKPVEMLKSTIEALVGGREFPVPAIPDIGSGNGNYRNVGGGGVEKFFGVDKVVEGPNSFSRNQQRGYERNFHVNSNSGYQRNNQWSTNTLRRLDAQSSRADFSKDFIDVFRDDY